MLAALQARCWSCHGTQPNSETPLKLLTYADLAAPSVTFPEQSNAQLSVDRMQNPLSPMPPGPFPVTQAQIDALQSWASNGLPMVDCPDVYPDPYAAPVQCTSGIQLPPNQQEGEEMNPGRACNACHNQVNAEGADAPIYAFAGTVFPTAHEPDDCVSTNFAGAQVEVVDINGLTVTIPVGPNGNFAYEDDTFMFTPPYRTKLIFQGRERTMDTPQVDGDCNTCHGQVGTKDAPGRIILP
ncbi:MAG: hypothetical protein QM820_33595 [Minicystis sp.]